MSDSPGDDHDSRTASVGLQRNSRGNSTTSSRHGSIDPSGNPRKRQRRNGRSSGDSRDFVPQGASFSANPLEVDPDSTSSSGSDSSDTDDSDTSSEDGNQSSSDAEQDTAPTVNWNQGAKSAIRTSLSSRKDKPEESKSSAQFDAVNGKYWRSRSESVSSAGDEKIGNTPNKQDSTEEGEVSEEGDSSESSQMQLSGDSDDSSLDSEADDSIMLNIGSRQTRNGAMSAGDDDYDPESLPVSGAPNRLHNGTTQDSATESKEDAFRRFSHKYPTHPSTLADLNQSDMDILARSIFYDRNIHDINLQLPVSCTECLREGHLAEVCPFKECVHCGAWNKHQSSFCPQWRRCQRCRARGHDEQQCASPLKSSASEIPCDLCGSSEHLELDCDFMWKLPRQDPSSGPVLVSLSCCHCTSTRHLLGDCPSLPKPILSSSWTLRGIDPHMVTNINAVVSGRAGAGATNGQRGGLKIRGRADRYSGSSDSEDLMVKPDRRPPVGRNANGNRPNIRIGSGIGKNKNLAPAGPRAADMGNRQTYRDRQDFPSGQARQRSLSPNPRPGRGRGRGGWQSRARSPQGRPKPPTNSRGAHRGGRGGGRGGGKRGGGGDAYRPMPSAAKKAWDKYRL